MAELKYIPGSLQHDVYTLLASDPDHVFESIHIERSIGRDPRRALSILAQDGHAEQVSRGHWRFATPLIKQIIAEQPGAPTRIDPVADNLLRVMRRRPPTGVRLLAALANIPESIVRTRLQLLLGERRVQQQGDLWGLT